MARNRYTYTADGPFAIHRMLPLLEAAKRDGIITDFGIEENGRRYYAMGPKLGERVTIYVRELEQYALELERKLQS